MRVGYGQLGSEQDFKLNILYEEPSLGTKRYLPIEIEPQYQGVPLIHIIEP